MQATSTSGFQKKCLNQTRKVRGHVFVCYVMYLCVTSCIFVLGVSILPLSTIFLLDFGYISTVWYFLLFFILSVENASSILFLLITSIILNTVLTNWYFTFILGSNGSRGRSGAPGARGRPGSQGPQGPRGAKGMFGNRTQTEVLLHYVFLITLIYQL